LSQFSSPFPFRRVFESNPRVLVSVTQHLSLSAFEFLCRVFVPLLPRIVIVPKKHLFARGGLNFCLKYSSLPLSLSSPPFSEITVCFHAPRCLLIEGLESDRYVHFEPSQHRPFPPGTFFVVLWERPGPQPILDGRPQLTLLFRSISQSFPSLISFQSRLVGVPSSPSRKALPLSPMKCVFFLPGLPGVVLNLNWDRLGGKLYLTDTQKTVFWFFSGEPCIGSPEVFLPCFLSYRVFSR